MAKIILDSEHNDTHLMFSRHSGVAHSNQFLAEPSAEARWQKKANWWLFAYAIALFAAVTLIPTPKAESLPKKAVAATKPFRVGDTLQLTAFKACPSGLAPLWIDSTTIQCFRELP